MARYEILCADNDALVRHVIAHEIEEAGHLVMSAGSGKAALSILAKNPTIDLVLADYCLPDMTGETLFHRIKSAWPKVKFGLLTGYAEILPLNPGDWSQGPDACPVIAKNARMEEILSAIEAAARGERHCPGQDRPMTRLEHLMSDRPARQAFESIQRQLQAIYEKTIPEALAKPFSRLLGRTSEPVLSETRR